MQISHLRVMCLSISVCCYESTPSTVLLLPAYNDKPSSSLVGDLRLVQLTSDSLSWPLRGSVDLWGWDWFWPWVTVFWVTVSINPESLCESSCLEISLHLVSVSVAPPQPLPRPLETYQRPTRPMQCAFSSWLQTVVTLNAECGVFV